MDRRTATTCTVIHQVVKAEEEVEVGNKNLQMNSYSYYQERTDLFLPKNWNFAFIFAYWYMSQKKYKVFLCSFIFYFLCDPSKHNVLPNWFFSLEFRATDL